MIDSIDIQEGKTANLRLRPPSRWSGSITAKVYDPDGRVIATPTATLDDVNATIATYAGNSTTQIALADNPDVRRGRVYEIADPERGEIRTEVKSTLGTAPKIVSLVDVLPGIPADGSAFRGFEVAVALSGAATATRNTDYRLSLTNDANDEEVLLVFNVCRHPFSFPVEVREIRSYMGEIFPSHPKMSDDEWITNRRDGAALSLRSTLLAVERYADRYWDRGRLYNIALVLVKLELAERGLIPRGNTSDDYIQRLKFDLRDATTALLSSVTSYDKNNDNATDEEEATPFKSIRLRRGRGR